MSTNTPACGLLDFKATIDVFAPEIPRASFKLVKKFCFLNEFIVARATRG